MKTQTIEQKKKEFLKEIRKTFNENKKQCICLKGLEFSQFTYDEFEELWDMCKVDITSFKGVHSIDKYRGSYSNTYFIYPNFCSQFKTLNRYLFRWNLKQLSFDDIRYDIVSGKRSSYDIEYRRLFAYNPSFCETILQFLKTNKLGTAGSVEMKFIYDKDYGDRFNSRGEDMECEWNGSFSYGLRITVYTKTRRVRATQDFYFYK